MATNKTKKKSFLVLFISIIFSIILFATLSYAFQSKGNGQEGQNQTPNRTQEQNRTQSQEQNRTRERNRTRVNNTFTPWQQRNEEECPETCKCVGAVVSCKTESGKIINITAGNSGNVITIIVNKTEVNTTLEIEQEEDNETNKSRFYAKMSNGKKSEIKIMPDTAAERALERLRLRICNETYNCTLTLKEVGNNKQKNLAYEMQIQRHVRLLGLFRAKIRERVQINAENGEIKNYRPWWTFLSKEE